MNLTEKSLQRLQPSKHRAHFYDDEVTGFGVRVDPNGRKSFFWRAKVRGVIRFRALGEFPGVSVKDARSAAEQMKGDAASWRNSGYKDPDPFERRELPKPANVPTFRELTEAYIARRIRSSANRPERAEYMARWMIKKHFADWLDRKLTAITIEDVLTVKNACGNHKHQANRCLEFVRTIFNWSSKSVDGKINFWPVANPGKDVSLYEEKERKTFLQPAELLRFNEELRRESNADLADFLTLAINTGARRSDIFSMSWSDIDWERRNWRVPYPKNGEAYDVSLLPAALTVLQRRRLEIADTETFVFPGIGRTGHLTDLKKQWGRFRVAARITHIRLHDLRRTVGSYLAMAGMNLPQIGAALGHRSLQSTQVYARLHDEAVRAAREAGQQKMIELMNAAKKRAKLTAKEQKLLGRGRG